MSNRSNNIDDRIAHDGIDRDPRHAPGEVKHLMRNGKRTDVTEQDRKAKVERHASLSFEEQKEAIRRGNSILASITLEQLEAGNTDERVVNNLGKSASITKQFLVEERQGGSGLDPKKLSDEEIERQLKNG